MSKMQVTDFDGKVIKFKKKKRTGDAIVGSNGVIHDAQFHQPRGRRGYKLLVHERQFLDKWLSENDPLTPEERRTKVLDETVCGILSGDIVLTDAERELLHAVNTP